MEGVWMVGLGGEVAANRTGECWGRRRRREEEESERERGREGRRG